MTDRPLSAEADQNDAVTNGSRPIPGTVLSDENLVSLRGRKHSSGVKLHTECGNMGAKRHGRRREFAASSLGAEFRIRDGSPMAVGKAE